MYHTREEMTNRGVDLPPVREGRTSAERVVLFYAVGQVAELMALAQASAGGDIPSEERLTGEALERILEVTRTETVPEAVEAFEATVHRLWASLGE